MKLQRIQRWAFDTCKQTTHASQNELQKKKPSLATESRDNKKKCLKTDQW